MLPTSLTDASSVLELVATTDDLDPSDPYDWMTWFLGAPLRIILIVGIGSLLLAILRRLIRRIAEHIADGTPLLERRGWKGIGESQVGALLRPNPLASARRAQRARTVGSVLRSAANVLIGVTIVLMVLQELGVNITPFLASAGIAGVALGFGAQSLVKDFLSGTFMLLEDQYGVGDVVDFGEVIGTVEEVALRVTKVRDANGTLWYVRNGEILRTGNKTQEWGRAVVEVRVAYYADIEKVKATLLAAADVVVQDDVLGTYCLEPPEVMGIEGMTAEALLLKVQVKTQAAMQWEVARALREQVRTSLSTARIPLAGAQQVVVLDHSPAEPDGPEAVGGPEAPDGPAKDEKPGERKPRDRQSRARGAAAQAAANPPGEPGTPPGAADRER